MHIFNLQQAFFLSIWRRLLVVVVCLGWAGVEFATAAPFWGMFFGGLGIYAVWQFFFDGWPGTSENSGGSG
ncbi:MAG: DUF3329 domain-containing protein [Hyphomicrobiales bacterium]|nr:DUF3329 domain-containing protein [Hyphomicrobiales bacterium]